MKTAQCITSTVEHPNWWLLQCQVIDRQILGLRGHPQVDRAFATARSGQWQSDAVYNVDLIDTA